MQTIPINTYNSPAVVLELIYQIKIKDAMTKNLMTVDEQTSLREIQALMKEKMLTGIPIVNGKHLLGIISVDDIIQALDFGYIEDVASKHMTRNLIVLEDDMPISFAISYFDRFKFHRFPVLNKNKELVGMITNRDITNSLLMELNKAVANLEKKQSFKIDKKIINQVQSFTVKKHDFEEAGYASTQIKKFLKKAGFPAKIIRRAAIACYELEMNIVVHSEGGEIIAEFSPEELIITANDCGPGIKDVNLALQKGWSTADEWIRSLGFGAGMGLPNVQSVSDDFSITSSKEGTCVVSTIRLAKQLEEEV